MAKSVLDELRSLDERRNQLLSSAKAEAMEKAKAAIEELNGLGFNFRITEGGVGSRKGTRQIDASKPCSICGFQTDTPHDARSHRTQKKKAPFTAAELAQRGWKKVS